MRDPNRLDNLYEKLKEIHKKDFPDWRFGQFMLNFLGWLGQDRDPFFPEDDAMIEYFEQYANHLVGPEVNKAELKPNKKESK